MERLDKFLARELNITRSGARSLIRSGGVSVNSSPACSADMKIDPDADGVFVNGREISYNKYVYIMMNKPKGVVSSSDGRRTGEKTVVDLLPPEMKRKDLFPAGRLDKDTTGFVLITDDGGFAHDILSPKNHIEKTYIAVLDKPFDAAVRRDFENGMELGGKTCMPAALESVGGHPACAKIVLKQGMYHQIKRMFKKHGITVLELKRVAMGALELDENLAPGQARYIGKEELSLVKKTRNMCDNR